MRLYIRVFFAVFLCELLLVSTVNLGAAGHRGMLSLMIEPVWLVGLAIALTTGGVLTPWLLLPISTAIIAAGYSLILSVVWYLALRLLGRNSASPLHSFRFACIEHLKPRVWIWTVALAFVGYAMAGKSTIGDVHAELIGVFGGAALGFIIGWIVQQHVERSRLGSLKKTD